MLFFSHTVSKKRRDAIDKIHYHVFALKIEAEFHSGIFSLLICENCLGVKRFISQITHLEFFTTIPCNDSTCFLNEILWSKYILFYFQLNIIYSDFTDMRFEHKCTQLLYLYNWRIMSIGKWNVLSIISRYIYTRTTKEEILIMSKRDCSFLLSVAEVESSLNQ